MEKAPIITPLTEEHYYLPAKDHARSVMETVKLQELLGDRTSDYEDGQFDDAEEPQL